MAINSSQANMRGLRTFVPYEYSSLYRLIGLAPEDDVTLIASEEIHTGFVVRRLVQLDSENVAVIQHAQSPAINFLE